MIPLRSLLLDSTNYPEEKNVDHGVTCLLEGLILDVKTNTEVAWVTGRDDKRTSER